MKNNGQIYTLIIGLIISVVLITSIAVYRNKIVLVYFDLAEQHPTVLRVLVLFVLLFALKMAFSRAKKK